jgi:DNA-binding response OmpR family regulator
MDATKARKDKPMNLLLIDGDLLFLNQLDHELHQHHFSTTTAKNAYLALKVLNEKKIDIIISGTNLPDKPLMNFVCSVKGRHADTPLILLTSFDFDYKIKAALLLGANACIEKPLNYSLLFATINKYMA